jgi:hypothetical protein
MIITVKVKIMPNQRDERAYVFGASTVRESCGYVAR